MIKKIISGGQIGADRVALDVAIKFNIPSNPATGLGIFSFFGINRSLNLR